MIDILSAYWKVAVKRIIDGVVMVLIDAYTSRTHFYWTRKMASLRDRFNLGWPRTAESFR